MKTCFDRGQVQNNVSGGMHIFPLLSHYSGNTDLLLSIQAINALPPPKQRKASFFHQKRKTKNKFLHILKQTRFLNITQIQVFDKCWMGLGEFLLGLMIGFG